MSTRGGGGGGGSGGRCGGGDFSRGMGHGGRRGRGRGDPLPCRVLPIADVRFSPPPTRHVVPSPSSSLVDPSTLSRDVEGLKITEAKSLAITARETDVSSAAPSSTKAMNPPKRPSYGTVGMQCMVHANHFLVNLVDSDLNLNHYDVAMTPEVTSKATCRDIISRLVTLYRDSHLGRLTPAYDGRKSLYTARPLPFTSQTFKIKLNDSRDREEEYNVTIKHAACADLHHLKEFLRGRQFDAPQETIKVLDVVLRQLPTQNEGYVTISRSFFSRKFATDIGDGVECWRGYYQSLRPTEMGLSLNMDISAAEFYKPVSVIEFAEEYLGLRDVSRPLTEKQHVGLKKALRGLKIEVTHQKDFRRRYKITGITSEPLNRLTFPVDDNGTKMSVMQYFLDKYQVRLEHVTWPCLQAGSDAKPTYLPMEVCKIVEGRRYTKKLNEKQVTRILRATCQRPHVREESVLQIVHENNYVNDEHAKEFGIEVVENMTLVEARVLPPPTLKYHDSGREKTCKPRMGAWNMINKRMVNGGSIRSWACISFSCNLRLDAVSKFCRSLFAVCGNVGMVINPNPVIPIMLEYPDNIEGALRKAQSQATAALKGGALQLLLIVLPEISGVYGTIKRVCETELGIVSQCFQPKQVQACKPQYMGNVALKINVKVGGRNTVLADALTNGIPLVTDKPTIIFGADVTHPPPGEDSTPSIAAVVATMDWPEVTKYGMCYSAQTRRKEMIKDLFIVTQDPHSGTVYGGMIIKLLREFERSTRRKPHRIIFYRDGVSEGQFNDVLRHEVDAIRRACQSIEEGYLPPITFVVVQKRHHTRLFPTNNQNTDMSGNILPGTVVDRKITHPTQFDFFLCSHAGIQGTSRPTYYRVLWDENNFTADALQSFTYNQCYTNARCTRSVSVVPPAFYAHQAASRARCYYVGRDSEGGSGIDRVKSNEVKPLPQIKGNVKEVMFFC